MLRNTTTLAHIRPPSSTFYRITTRRSAITREHLTLILIGHFWTTETMKTTTSWKRYRSMELRDSSCLTTRPDF